MAKRGTKAQSGETVGAFYAIHPETRRVVTISLTRGGQLSYFSPSGNYLTHAVDHGRNAKAEIHLVWGLLHIREVSHWPDADNSAVERELERIAESLLKEQSPDDKG